ncbi:MAG TPA: hypothetical protein VGI10_15125 [Polyangiaceae bacterium]|jgi:hypothetical protein
MSADPLDVLSARLFEAARDEPLPEGAERRAVEAGRAGFGKTHPGRALRSRVRVSAIWLFAAVLAAAALVLARRHDAATSISAEPSSPARPARHDERTSPPAAATNAEPANGPQPPSAPITTPGFATPARSAPPTLADELSTLKLAESALSAGDAESALKTLDRYDHVLQGRQMRAEATLLRIEALSRAGKPAAAAVLASKFVEQNPESPLVDRARSFIQH